MKRRTWTLFLLALAALTTFALPAAAAQPTVRLIRHPTVIDRPGSYLVVRNLYSNDGTPAITITADEVSLDLGGYRLAGPGDRVGVGVAVMGATDVRIRNGSLERFGIGVLLKEATNAIVENLQIDGLDSGGSPPDVEIGVLALDTRGARIANNVISDTFLGIFVRGDGSVGNLIKDNVVTAGEQGELGICFNPAPGQTTGGPHGNLVTGNLVSRFRRGLSLSTDSSGNVVRGNTLAYIDLSIQEATTGSNLIADNDEQQITR